MNLKKLKYCPTCGHVGKPEYRGSLWITLFLLVFTAIIGGIIYEMWRTAGGPRKCPNCKAVGMIPADSPAAKVAMAFPTSQYMTRGA